MQIIKIKIHNYRSIVDAEIEAHGFLLLVGANNAGKSNVLNALRCFYEDAKWTDEDFPKKGNKDEESWVELTFELSNDEWENLADKYKEGKDERHLTLRRHFNGEKAKTRQSNIYAVVNGQEEPDLFYDTKNIATAKFGRVLYVPALTTPSEQLKTTGPSPLRNMLNFIFNKAMSQSQACQKLVEVFKDLNEEAKGEDGFLTAISGPINSALSQWNIKIDLSVNSISSKEITKSLVNCAFVDSMLGDTAFGLDRFGHGFQRSLIYELIRIASSFQYQNVAQNKEYNPNFTLLLFEEPEAFLHPSQQENMAYHLRKLVEETNHQVQVFTTSHSPVFVGKNSDELCQICRIGKNEGVSQIYQLSKSDKDGLINARETLRSALDAGDNEQQEEIASQEEIFRFQLWLDSERASMFFADKVLLVEGATEKALFNYLLARDWHDLTDERILVVDAFGKYNFNRFLTLFKAYGIYHGIIFDKDNDKNGHAVLNQCIRDGQNEFTLAAPFEFDDCIERYLALDDIPRRNDRKPLEILKALVDKKITAEKIAELREAFCKSMAIKKS